jgi:hypothetical protein
MVKATKEPIHSFSFCVLSNEFLHKLPQKDDRKWFTVSSQQQLAFSIPLRNIPTRISSLKKVIVRKNEKVFALKPFSESRKRDSSAISVVREDGSTDIGRITKITFYPSVPTSGKPASIRLSVRVFAKIPGMHGFPRYFQLLSSSDSRVQNFELSAFAGTLILFQSPHFAKIENKEIVIGVEPVYRFS